VGSGAGERRVGERKRGVGDRGEDWVGCWAEEDEEGM